MCSLGTVFNDKSIWSRTFKFPMVTLPLFKIWLLHLHLCELQQVIELLHLSPFICKVGRTPVPCCCPGNWGHRRLVSPMPHILVPSSLSCGSSGQFLHLLPGSYPKCPAHNLHFSASGLLPRPGGLTQPVHGAPWNAGGQRSYCAHGQKVQGQDPASWPLKGPCEALSLCPAGETATSSLHPFNLLPVFMALIVTWNYLLCLFPGGQLQKRGL